MDVMLLLFVLLFIKHFIADFPLQSFPYIYGNKGTYGHAGGLLHAGIHWIGTTLVFWPFVGLGSAIGLGFLDALIHYHIDWAKMNINSTMKWSPTNSEGFWVLLGADQLFHYLTYALLIYLAL